MKNPKQLERYFKGAANHNRIEILKIVAKNEGINVDDISKKLNADFKNISQHTHRLVAAGLLNKKYSGNNVQHSLSPYGEKFIKFFTEF
ncbi:MAG: helix-turn-helix transcriptional regulator [bacterium]|nr:helix-turn-helix transcriptional regulator [bacterium]